MTGWSCRHDRRQVDPRSARPADVSLPDPIHALALTGEQNGRELTIHPSAVETERGLLLVDVGLPGMLDELREALDDAEWGLGDVWGVVVTHQDGDHVGGLATLLDTVEADHGHRPFVFAHPEAAPFVDGRREPLKGDGGRGYPPVTVDVEVPDGTTFQTAAGPMRIVHTPGHTPGHVSVYFPEERTLLAADALTVDDGLAGPPEGFTLDVRAATRSVGVLADLRLRRVLAYHGGSVEIGADTVERLYDELATDHDVA